MKFIPREKQKKVLEYTKGTMCVSAVPGAGKTITLSALAADLIEKNIGEQPVDSYENPGHEILVVTFSNAAQISFASKIAGFLKDRGITPNYGYRVSTIHSLATDILRGHTSGIGLSEDFQVADELSSNEFVRKAVTLWMKEDQDRTLSLVLDSKTSPGKKEEFKKNKWFDKMVNLSSRVISKAKDLRLQPEDLRSRLPLIKDSFAHGLLEAVCTIYEHYQTNLRNCSAMDFADLMLNVHRVLESDPEYLSELQERCLYLLEDEAQDSTRIQEELLKLLSGKHGNWVRVGDTNQSINASFTESSPKYMENFLKNYAKKEVTLDVAGRSQRCINMQANYLVNYVINEHPDKFCRSALKETYIKQVKEENQQKNPEARKDRVSYKLNYDYRKNEEINTVCRMAVDHVRNNPDETTVILVPTNSIGLKYVEKLSEYPVDVIEVLKSTKKSRNAVKTIAEIISWLSEPLNKRKLITAFKEIYNEKAPEKRSLSREDSLIAETIMNETAFLEDYLYPMSEDQFEEMASGWDLNEMLLMKLFEFRQYLTRWIEARFLPVESLVLLIAQDLFDDPDDLSCAGQLGNYLKLCSRADPSADLNNFYEEAMKIAEGKRGKIASGLHGKGIEYVPDLYPGKIAVTTYHSSKGLEWDQVFATNISNFHFPEIGGRDEKKSYIRENLDLEYEMISALEYLSNPEKGSKYIRGKGTQLKWRDYVCERIRLLYVGITRAKKGLYMSGSTPPAIAIAMENYWLDKLSGGFHA